MSASAPLHLFLLTQACVPCMKKKAESSSRRPTGGLQPPKALLSHLQGWGMPGYVYNKVIAHLDSDSGSGMRSHVRAIFKATLVRGEEGEEPELTRLGKLGLC